MKKQVKSWAAFGAVFAAATGAQAMGTVEPLGMPTQIFVMAQAHQHAANAGEAGEAGESGGQQDMDLAVDDANFIAILGEVEGHLRAAYELYRLGAVDLSKTHVKHPKDELYADLLPVFEKRGLKGFDAELVQMAALIESGAKAEDVLAALNATVVAIDENSASLRTAKTTVEAVHLLARTAAAEYKIGVEAGNIKDPHEFQDAWGFTETAKRLMAALSETERAVNAGAVNTIIAQLESLAPAWNDLTGASGTNVEANVLAATAARIEIAALSVK